LKNFIDNSIAKEYFSLAFVTNFYQNKIFLLPCYGLVPWCF